MSTQPEKPKVSAPTSYKQALADLKAKLLQRAREARRTKPKTSGPRKPREG